LCAYQLPVIILRILQIAYRAELVADATAHQPVFIDFVASMNAEWIPIMIKVITVCALLLSQIANSLVQVLLWIIGDRMCIFFGVQYVEDLLIWIAVLLLFLFELKYIQRMTRYHSSLNVEPPRSSTAPN
jgi:hypothetical protein